MSLVLGAIADDLTGATDLANTLVRGGMRTLQVIGVPATPIDLRDTDAVVIALKSRTIPANKAVTLAVEALQWLQDIGVHQFFFKYCSTFDSTSDGNIGPVADAFVDFLKPSITVVCPAFPGAGRTIYQGHLFVGDQLLSDSSMRDHPLTPMTDSNLVRLMSAQSNRKVELTPLAVVELGSEAIAESFRSLAEDGHCYVVVDALNDEHMKAIAASVAEHSLVTGGSGVALGLPENYRRLGLLDNQVVPELQQKSGRAVVIAGSCSKATRSQIDYVRNDCDWPSYRLDPYALGDGDPVIEEVTAWADRQSTNTPLIIYASADPEEVAAVQLRYGRDKAGALIENALAMIAVNLVSSGVRQLIIAGGETAGAVVSALDIAGLRIGPEIDPGVPWTETLSDPPLALALKSGNFGSKDFFLKAFGIRQ